MHPEGIEPDFRSAQIAMERDLEKTNLADVINEVKASGACPPKKPVDNLFFLNNYVTLVVTYDGKVVET